MRAFLAFSLLLSAPLSAQLAFRPASVDLGQVPVGARRLTTVRLYNLGAMPVLVEAVTPMDMSLTLPAPPVTDVAHWLAGMDSMEFSVSAMPVVPGALHGRLQARSPTDTVSLVLRADGVRIFISEVLADPAAGSAGDANGDGERQTYADEFVELHNSGPQTVDIGGWRLSDDDAPEADGFVFPPTALPPGGFAVLFGGGTPAAIAAPTFVDDGRIGDGLANMGDRVLLLTAGRDTASVANGSDWGHDRSLSRSSGDDPLLPHDSVPGVTELFSPGRDARIEESEAIETPGRAAATVLIVEILADPASGDAGDANGDGVRDTYADEFIELLNIMADDVDISGWSLGDDDTDDAGRFHFPSGTVLAAGSRLVLFGGGSPAAPWAFVDDGRIGNGLTNSGDVITLRDAAGDTVDSVDGSGWPADRASVRSPENCLAGCEWRPHRGLPSSVDRFSPGVAGSTQGAGMPSPSGTAADIRIAGILSRSAREIRIK